MCSVGKVGQAGSTMHQPGPQFGHHRCIDLSIKGGVGGTPTNRGGLEGGGRNAREYIGFGQGACGKQHCHQIPTTLPALTAIYGWSVLNTENVQNVRGVSKSES